MAQLELRLQEEIVRRYGLLPAAAVAIHNGDEASVWRVQTTPGPVVVRVGPAWRTAAEVAWVHDLLDYAAHALDVAVAPLPARDGTTAFWWRGRPVALFPFVAGTVLDRENPHLRREAARLLARVHYTLRRWPDPRPRPPPGPHAPSRWPRPADPSALVDPELEAWYGAWSQGRTRAATPVHGDFYRRNVLCRAGRIVGLIDWDEARLEAPVREVAWAAYRVGDSPVNPVTPLLAYLPLILVTAQKYRKDAGVGTIIAMMLPYAAAILVVWTVLLVLWYVLGIPLGIGTGSPRG
jgi:Ser/Thr protein kinase RdoA (MazF antagonist)